MAPTTTDLLINLGAGGQSADGWIAVDRAGPVDVTCDLRDGLPFDTGTARWVTAHHVFDMFTPTELAAVLLDCRRVLTPGGVLRASLADVELVDTRWRIAMAKRNAGLLEEGNADVDRLVAFLAPLVRVDPGMEPVDVVRRYITLDGARCNPMTARTFIDALSTAGFNNTAQPGFETTMFAGDDAICVFDSRPEESLFFEGRVWAG